MACLWVEGAVTQIRLCRADAPTRGLPLVLAGWLVIEASRTDTIAVLFGDVLWVRPPADTAKLEETNSALTECGGKVG
jgi:hypothetical protein